MHFRETQSGLFGDWVNFVYSRKRSARFNNNGRLTSHTIITATNVAGNSPTGCNSSIEKCAVTNPNMSVIGDFRMSYQSPAQRHVDAEFHEAEIALQSVVDPYARADFFLSVARDPVAGTFGLDLEEAYLTSLDLPAALQLKVGKFRSAFGKINSIHPHRLPFIDVPNANVHYLGEDGLNDEGLSLSWLVPNPMDFYQELTSRGNVWSG